MKVIRPKIKKFITGNIYKYNSNNSFFKKGIRDIYLTDVIFNNDKVDKIKKKDTLLFVINGKIDLIIKKKKNKHSIIKLNSKDRNFYLIQKGVLFALKNNFKKNALIMSFLNEKY
jgi:hypothetical protein